MILVCLLISHDRMQRDLHRSILKGFRLCEGHASGEKHPSCCQTTKLCCLYLHTSRRLCCAMGWRCLLQGAEQRCACAGLGIRRALILVASQKTLTVAMPVLAGLASASAGTLRPELVGIAALPCVLVHLLQTVIDFLLVARWRAVS